MIISAIVYYTVTWDYLFSGMNGKSFALIVNPIVVEKSNLGILENSDFSLIVS
jgi:outer membrane protein assembly factor BamE (lipoprotein component of BamABCDE complex)